MQSPGWEAAKAATATIPIVFTAGTDPIDLGLVTNFRRPTANVTGFNIFAEVLTPKRQELLHELVPAAPLVAMSVNPKSPQTQSELRNVQAAADILGQPVYAPVRGQLGRRLAAFRHLRLAGFASGTTTWAGGCTMRSISDASASKAWRFSFAYACRS